MTSRRFYILPAVATSLLAWHSSYAMPQMYDLYFHVFNNTHKNLILCPKKKGDCEVVKPGAQFWTAHADTDEAEKKLADWLADSTLETCGKKRSLDALLALPAFEKKAGQWGHLSYSTKMTDQDIAPLCEGTSE